MSDLWQSPGAWNYRPLKAARAVKHFQLVAALILLLKTLQMLSSEEIHQGSDVFSGRR